MSDYDPYALGAVPTGRRLDQDTGHPKSWFGLVSMFPQATPQRIEAARKNAREIPDERLDRSVDPWRDRETGEEFEMVKSYFDIISPESSGAVAFTVSDGNIIGLRPAGYEDEIQSVHVGNLGGGRA